MQLNGSWTLKLTVAKQIDGLRPLVKYVGKDQSHVSDVENLHKI